MDDQWCKVVVHVCHGRRPCATDERPRARSPRPPVPIVRSVVSGSALVQTMSPFTWTRGTFRRCARTIGRLVSPSHRSIRREVGLVRPVTCDPTRDPSVHIARSPDLRKRNLCMCRRAQCTMSRSSGMGRRSSGCCSRAPGWCCRSACEYCRSVACWSRSRSSSHIAMRPSCRRSSASARSPFARRRAIASIDRPTRA